MRATLRVVTGVAALAVVLLADGCAVAHHPAAPSQTQLARIEVSVRAAQTATFKAVYRTTTSGSAPETVTLEQAPPRSRFASGTTSVVDTGASTYLCLTATVCTKEGSGATNPMSTLTDLFSASAVLRTLQAAQTQVGQHASVTVAFSAKTIAAEPCQCFAITVAGETSAYCVTATGVLASSQVGGSSFTLVSLTTNVPARDFNLPGSA